MINSLNEEAMESQMFSEFRNQVEFEKEKQEELKGFVLSRLKMRKMLKTR